MSVINTAHADGTAPRVVLIATARPTFAVDVAKQRAEAARALLVELGADVSGPVELVMTAEDVAAAAAYLDDDADLVVNVCASFSDATPALELYAGLTRPPLLWAFREPGQAGDRLWLNSLCGANLFGHALVVHAGQTPRLVYGDPDEAGVRSVLEAALLGDLPAVPALPTYSGSRDQQGVAQAIDSLRGSIVGLVGEAPPGFTPSQYDGDLIKRVFGISIEMITVDEMFARVNKVPGGDRQSEKAAALAAQPTIGGLDPAQVDLSAAVTTAMRTWKAEQDLGAMAIRCWPEFPASLGVCPCASLSRLADEGTPTACERDVYGAVTMMLLESLGSGTTYLVDTVELDADANVVRVWHCGAAATSLAADPDSATQSVHCNRKIGVAGDFPLRTGRVVLARLTEDPEPASDTGLRLLIVSGESISEPNRFQGNSAAVHLDASAEDFVYGLISSGFPHHTVIAWRDIRASLRAAADAYGIPVVEYTSADHTQEER